MKKIPYGRQNIDSTDIKAVEDVLQSEWLTQGPAVGQFEQAVLEFCGATYAIAFNSATSALHVACMAAGVGAGDLVWTVPNTFVASANCALYCGGMVDFVDIDAKTYNMDVAKLADKLADCRATNKQLPKVVIPVDFSGQPCPLAEIRKLADEYGFIVIEDASHAIGATYRESKIGDCAYADMTVFSFHPVKIVTSGEGGMITTNNAKLAEKAGLLRSHGITRTPGLMVGENHGDWYYQQIDLGFNYRMTDLQAILGYSQMKRIEAFLARRRQLAVQYDEKLSGLPLVTPYLTDDVNSAWHLYVVLLKNGAERKRIFDAMRALNIMVNVHYVPVYTQPYYEKLGFGAGLCPVAEDYYWRTMSIPMYYDLTDQEQDYVVGILKELLA